MKIKTITCHDVYNHGASLQAYALQTFLEELGHQVEIIDYKPAYLSQEFSLLRMNPCYDIPVIRWFYLIAKLPSRLWKMRRKRPFDQFTKQYLHLTKRYKSFIELRNSPPEADYFIAGSDQIWNTLFQNGRDPAFYLDFVPETKKRISYAASFGTVSIDPAYIPFVSDKLSGFDAVSIRERASLPLLSSLGRDDGVVVCDPVLLFDDHFWRRFSRKGLEEKSPYLLIYDFEASTLVRDIAQFIAVKKGLRIINISPRTANYADRNYCNVSPIDFVSLIRNANYIISNSFHATVFSIIFQRNFCVVNRLEELNVRMKSLLEDLLLQDRIVNTYGNELLEPIHYQPILEKLLEMQNRSKNFLNAIII